MSDIEVCPFCGTSSHKIMSFSNGIKFCKECSRFFKLEVLQPRCPKCNSPNVENSDFPLPNGEVVIHCNICKKNFSAKDFFELNGAL